MICVEVHPFESIDRDLDRLRNKVILDGVLEQAIQIREFEEAEQKRRRKFHKI